MRLTKNEKKALKLILNNGKVSDTKIAEILKISKPAVGKIRKKLDQNMIKNYSVELNYGNLGINVLAIEIVKIELHENEKASSKNLINIFLNNPHCTKVYKLPEQNLYCIHYAFRDLLELNNFFNNNPYIRTEFGDRTKISISHQNLKIFSYQSLLKDNSKDLFNKMIDEF